MDFGDDIKSAVDTLRKGGVILYPTDTIWGLGCDATLDSAVEKIFSIKHRDSAKSLIVLVSSINMLERYVSAIPEAALSILEVSDSPVTIIYPRGRNLAGGVCSADGSVGIRLCNDEFCNELITRFRKPIVSTSANPGGMNPPGNFDEIDQSIIRSADYVVRHRQDDRGVCSPSPIIKIDMDGVFRIIRK